MFKSAVSLLYFVLYFVWYRYVSYRIDEKLSIFSPPENDSFRKDLCFTHDVFWNFFFQAQDLRDAWADRREILHDGQY